MLDAIYVDTVQDHSIAAIRPKLAFQPLFEVATTRQESDVVLINEPPSADMEPGAADSCFWWRRGRPRLQLTPTTKMAARCTSYTWKGTRGRPSSAYFNIFASAPWCSRLYHAPSSDQPGCPERADSSAELTSTIRKSRGGTNSG